MLAGTPWRPLDRSIPGSHPPAKLRPMHEGGTQAPMRNPTRHSARWHTMRLPYRHLLHSCTSTSHTPVQANPTLLFGHLTHSNRIGTSTRVGHRHEREHLGDTVTVTPHASPAQAPHRLLSNCKTCMGPRRHHALQIHDATPLTGTSNTASTLQSPELDADKHKTLTSTRRCVSIATDMQQAMCRRRFDSAL